MDQSLPFGRYTIIGHDASGYSSLNGRQQHQLQTDLVALMDAAAAGAGLSRDRWWRQARGDGELAVLPPSERETTVVDDYVRHLAHGLRMYNADRAPGRRMGLRLAVHHGEVDGAPLGAAGDGVVDTARLLDSAAARDALAAVGGEQLVVVLSATVFKACVRSERITLDPSMFRPVWVANKGFETWAYVLVLDAAADTGEATADDSDVRPEGEPASSRTGKQKRGRAKSEQHVVNKLKDVKIDNAVFGFGSLGHD